MDFGIAGRTALVLGAGGGLGRAIAVALAREGANVALGDIDGSALSETAKAVKEAGGSALPIEWDVTDFDATARHTSEIEAALGPVDILVNNTGGPAPSAAQGVPKATWRGQFDAMVLAVIALTDLVLPGMKSRNWGRIVTSTSSGVVSPIPNLAVSNALRLSLVGWSKTLAREVAADGVTVNVILPGRIATGRIRFLDEQKAKRENRSLESVVADSTASIPAGRYGRPEEYGDAVAFLASNRASYITGSILRVDGGYISSI